MYGACWTNHATYIVRRLGGPSLLSVSWLLTHLKVSKTKAHGTTVHLVNDEKATKKEGYGYYTTAYSSIFYFTPSQPPKDGTAPISN